MRKLPHVTVLFWVPKIVATTLGETGGDLLAQTVHVGYLVSTVIFFALFLIAVVFQLKARRFHPAIFWTVIALTSTAGTTLSDLMNRTGGIGYAGGALILTTGLVIVFVIWWRSGQTLDVEKVATFKGNCSTGSRFCSPTAWAPPVVTSWLTALGSDSATVRRCCPRSCWLCLRPITSPASTAWFCSGSRSY
jgi:hypothetical protein